jgi:hypothetical protein
MSSTNSARRSICVTVMTLRRRVVYPEYPEIHSVTVLADGSVLQRLTRAVPSPPPLHRYLLAIAELPQSGRQPAYLPTKTSNPIAGFACRPIGESLATDGLFGLRPTRRPG